MAFPPMPSPMTCPNCGTRFVVEIHTIIDVGQEPELKQAFMGSRINYASCPQCDFDGIVSTPLVYHDPEHELLISFVPQELEISGDDREKLVGRLLNAVMQSVPQEQRKGYFLQPRTALTYEGLLEAVFETEGITQEMLEERRKVMQLLDSLLGSLDDADALKALAEEHAQRLDYGFFLLLSSLIDAAQDDPEIGLDADRLEQLRGALLDLVGPPAPPAAPADANADDLIALLSDAQDDQAFQGAVMLNRAKLDYTFFQALTQRIEAAAAEGDTARAEALTDLRQRILEAVDQQRQAIQELEDEAQLLVAELLGEEDVAQAVRAHRDELNDIVLTTALRLRQTAERKGNQPRVAKLDALVNAILETMEESLPPKQRLINQLFRAETPEETGRILEANRGLLDDDLVEGIESYIAELSQNRDERAQELADHLRGVLQQIEAKRTIQRG